MSVGSAEHDVFFGKVRRTKDLLQALHDGLLHGLSGEADVRRDKSDARDSVVEDVGAGVKANVDTLRPLLRHSIAHHSNCRAFTRLCSCSEGAMR